MKISRKRLFEIFEADSDKSLLSKVYDITMMLVIIFTVIELVSSGTNTVVAKGYAQFGAMEYGVGSAMLWFYFMVVGLFLALFFFVYNRVFVKKWG